jgi:cytochrome P450 family 26 subfamily A
MVQNHVSLKHSYNLCVQDTAEPVGGASKEFMAFGGGLRLCVGADFAKMQIAIFLHCLVTKYR